MKTIDLRSDTVTRPTPPMREAMARAEVGDDVYGEDPSVNLLQERIARLLGKEAALFVPSGTMANQLAIRAQTQHGDVVLAGEHAHVLLYESGAAAALSGVQIDTLGVGGFFDGDDVRTALHPRDHHYAPTTLVAMENTHTVSGGRVFALERIRGVAQAARECDLRLHLDGARLWNAVVATGIPAATWAEPFDSVSCCLSKGLGAPVGSVVSGSAEIVERMHRFRKMLGGGMRQAGILAAAGLYALDHHVTRLGDDHSHARRLAAGLRELGLKVRNEPDTNMVLFDVDDVGGFARATRSRKLLIDPIAPGTLRAVTHLDVDAADVGDALARIAEALTELRGGAARHGR
ncbi:MAG TPA: low-specificity L-threonine aldolase [Myxococcota bacterium]|nr:low-specificity L-threonine aldolase [Myxococcota bacterium]